MRILGRGRMGGGHDKSHPSQEGGHKGGGLGGQNTSRRALRRSMSAPTQHVASSSASGLETPGGYSGTCSLSQNDALGSSGTIMAGASMGEYRTPQSNRCGTKLSGAVREKDWGVSRPASVTVLTRLQPELYTAEAQKKLSEKGENSMGNGGGNGVGKPPIARSHSALGHIESASFHGNNGGSGSGGDGGSGGPNHVHGPVNLIMGCVFSPTTTSLPGQGLGQGQGVNLSSVSRPVAMYGGYNSEQGSGGSGSGGRGGINAMDIAGAGSGSGSDSGGLRKGRHGVDSAVVTCSVDLLFTHLLNSY